MSKPSRRQFRILTGVAISLAIVLLISLYAWRLTIHQVTCLVSADQTCPEQTNAAVQQLLGQPLLFHDVQQTIEHFDLIQGQYTVVSIKRSLDGSVTIMLQAFSPAYLLEYQSKRLAVAQSGKILEFITEGSNPSNCPIQLNESEYSSQILSSDGATAVAVAPEFHQQVLALVQQLQSTPLPCESIQPIDGQTWLIATQQTPRIVINPNELTEDLDRLTSYQSTKDQINAADYQYLDVRFKLPVLRNTL